MRSSSIDWKGRGADAQGKRSVPDYVDGLVFTLVQECAWCHSAIPERLTLIQNDKEMMDQNC